MKKISFCFIILYFSILSNAQYSIDIDSTFGDNGLVEYQIPGPTNFVRSIKEISNNEILALGEIQYDSFLIGKASITKLSNTGALDQNFGVGGHFTFETGDVQVLAQDALELPNGDLIIQLVISSTSTIAALIKIDPNGTIIESFGDQGLVIFDLDTGNTELKSIRLDNQGQVLVCGRHYDPNEPGAMVTPFLSKYSTDGILDLEFGTDGFHFLPTSGIQQGFFTEEILFIQSDDKIILRHYEVNAEHIPYISRHLPSGELDPSFNNNQYKQILENLDYTSYYISDFETNESGISYIGGFLSLANGNEQYILAKLLPDFSQDLQFGEQGIVFLTENYPHIFMNTNAIFSTPDYIVVAGLVNLTFPQEAIFLQLFDLEGNPMLDQGVYGLKEFQFGTFYGWMFEKGDDGYLYFATRKEVADEYITVIRRFKEVKTPSTKVQEVSVRTKTTIYPNPSWGTFRLELESPLNDMVHFELFDATGSLAHKFTGHHLDAGRNTIFLKMPEHLPKGTYILQGRSSSSFISEKIVYFPKG